MDINSIDYIALCVNSQEIHPALENDDRVEMVVDTYTIARRMFARANAIVTYKLHEPFRSMGTVTILGTNLEVSRLVNVFRRADNIDVFPRTNGTVQVNITFHGLTK